MVVPERQYSDLERAPHSIGLQDDANATAMSSANASNNKCLVVIFLFFEELNK